MNIEEKSVGSSPPGLARKRVGTNAEWVYKARRERAEGLWLELEITEAPCTDSMSGESFPYKAVVTFEDRRMEGCAS